MTLFKLALSSACLLCFANLHATDYFVSAGGDDSNVGTLPSKAWATVHNVNASSFRAGDRILFEGGKTFSGTIALDTEDAGTVCAPIVVSSYGVGRATIESVDANGLRATGCRFVQVLNLNFAGSGRDGGHDNVGIYFDGVQHGVIDQVDAHGYRRAGLQIHNSQHIRVTHIYATLNGYVGINCTGRSKDVYVGYCRVINNPGFQASRNHSGNGILFENGPSNCLIEYCEAADNGWDMGNKTGDNGPCGIWTWDVDNVNIQYCISHDNKTTRGDGNGFDLDGMTRNSYVQYCYSYNNQGCGYLIMPFQRDKGPSNNVIRYCVSENDGDGCVRFYGRDLNAISITNNVLYNDKTSPIRSVISGNDAKNVGFYNNIILTRGDYNFIDENDQYRPADFSKGRILSVAFQGNCYYNYNGQSKWLNYDSLDEWREAGKEMSDGRPVGMNLDPLLKDAGQGEKLTDPTQLPRLLAYLLQPASPCIDAGVAAWSPPGRIPLTEDFYGNSLPNDQAIDIGIHELLIKPVMGRW